jgi:hypothetical protein
VKKLKVLCVLIISSFLFSDSHSQVSSSLTGQAVVKFPNSDLYVIYDQMNYPGTNSISSQNFETSLDNYDSFAADDFALMDMIWNIESIDVLGAYFSGSGPAISVNVWIYNCNGSGGLPIDIVYSALNVIPSAGLVDGSFSIPLPVTAVLNEGWYWLCVQANMDLNSGGQWGWTERTFQDFSESAWKNPGGGLGTPCTPNWGYRVTNCVVGSQPDNCFRFNGYVTPVELISFTAVAIGSEVKLNWSTATETNNQGFEILRLTQNDNEWNSVGFVPGFGTTTEPKSYSYTDSEVSAGKYTYRLKQIDFDGSSEYSPEVEVEITTLLVFSLSQNYPNPFNPSTKISWQSPVSGHQTIKVFDVLGNQIATLVDEYKPAGSYEVEFNASSGIRNLVSGIYFYQLKAGDYINTKKMLLLK